MPIYTYHAPLDPECPVVEGYLRALYDDPMTRAYGAPVDEIVEHFEHKHRAECERCVEYGVANIEVNP